jgi:arsenate reductase
MHFICYPKCTTCAKARTWLEEHSIAHEERNIKTANPSVEELKLWHKLSGLPLRRLFNTSGMQYRALGLSGRLDKMTVEEQFAVLASDGMLVKRPLLVGEDFVLIGFKEKEWGERLL